MGSKGSKQSKQADRGEKAEEAPLGNQKPRKSQSLATTAKNISTEGAASQIVREIVHVHEPSSTAPSIFNLYEGLQGRPIGKGGTSSVLRVTRKDTEQEYALKVINMHRLSSSKRMQLLREVEIMRSLDHPSIIRIHEVFKTEFVLYIVMEFCDGGELFDELEEHENMQMPESVVRDYAEDILRALSYIHRNGIVHRDLKLENFIFSSKNRERRELKMIDFGYSRTYLEGEYMTSLVGTAFYIAPEVLEGRYGNEADMWSFGCMLFMMITGEIPIVGRNDFEVMENVRNAKNKNTLYGDRARRLLRGNLSSECSDFINMCMTVDPAKRPTAAGAFDHPWFSATLGEGDVSERHESLGSHEVGQRIDKFKSFTTFKKLALIAASVNLASDGITELKAKFEEIDTNHTGTITFDEFARALKSTQIPNSELESLFKAVDQDHTGQIKYTEFIASCADEKLLLDQHALVGAFNSLDLDGDGTITRDELKTMLGADANDAALDALIADADFHKDGVIHKDEFLRAMRGNVVESTMKNAPE